MKMFLILFAAALLASACGFKKYVWFISIGYGAAVALIGAVLLGMFHSVWTLGPVLLCLLFMVYGFRLSGYLAIRELKSSYNSKMKKEIKSGKDVPFAGKMGIWISAAILYVCETAPVWFRFAKVGKTDVFCIAGLLISVFGLCFESLADWQKNEAKKKNPKRFVDTGLYRIVRCPNYLGEMIFWTGIFVSGLNLYAGIAEWAIVLVGYIGIIYVMFGGARRLEIRQNRTYGSDPVYQEYVRTTPIMLAFVPLYSVEKYKWLVA